MDEPPVWLLDVDGVLNAVTTHPDQQVWPDWRRVFAAANGVSWPIWFSPSVTATVTGLHEAGLADVRWLTTWGDDANGELRRRLELPRLTVSGRGGVFAADGLDWWKFAVVRALHRAQPDRRLIWTDDDLRYLPEVQAWMQANTRSLVIAPRPDHGLTPDQLDEIRRFCADPALEPK
jgi:hypothetical protein